MDQPSTEVNDLGQFCDTELIEARGGPLDRQTVEVPTGLQYYFIYDPACLDAEVMLDDLEAESGPANMTLTKLLYVRCRRRSGLPDILVYNGEPHDA